MKSKKSSSEMNIFGAFSKFIPLTDPSANEILSESSIEEHTIDRININQIKDYNLKWFEQTFDELRLFLIEGLWPENIELLIFTDLFEHFFGFRPFLRQFYFPYE